MGLFLAVSGVIGASSSEVQTALKQFAEAKGSSFELVTKGAPGNPGIGVITLEGANTSVMYPEDFMDWDKASKSISEILARPVFSFHIHDDDMWMYILFDNGKEVDHFNPIPDYWGDISPREKEKWKGNASNVAQVVPGVQVDTIYKYLMEWDLEQEDQIKAYPEDEFTIGDCWQLTDFMTKIGLQYPMDDEGCLDGAIYRLPSDTSWSKHTSAPAEQRQKPWWKLW